MEWYPTLLRPRRAGPPPLVMHSVVSPGIDGGTCPASRPPRPPPSWLVSPSARGYRERGQPGRTLLRLACAPPPPVMHGSSHRKPRRVVELLQLVRPPALTVASTNQCIWLTIVRRHAECTITSTGSRPFLKDNDLAASPLTLTHPPPHTHFPHHPHPAGTSPDPGAPGAPGAPPTHPAPPTPPSLTF